MKGLISGQTWGKLWVREVYRLTEWWSSWAAPQDLVEHIVRVAGARHTVPHLHHGQLRAQARLTVHFLHSLRFNHRHFSWSQLTNIRSKYDLKIYCEHAISQRPVENVFLGYVNVPLHHSSNIMVMLLLSVLWTFWNKDVQHSMSKVQCINANVLRTDSGPIQLSDAQCTR